MSLLIGVTIAGGVVTGFGFHRLTELASRPKDKSISQLVRGLEKQDSRSDLVWQALWPKLPNFVTSRLPSFAPVTAVSIRRDAGTELIHRGPAAAQAIPGLISALRDPDIQVRSLAVQALAKLGPTASSALNALTAIFQDERNDLIGLGADSVRGQAALALAAIGPEDPRVAELLCDALLRKGTNGAPSHIRYYVLRALERIASETNGVVRTLMSALKEATAESTLPNLRPDAESNELQTRLALQRADANANFAGQILATLGRIGPSREEVVSVLVEHLQSKDERIRSAAVLALANAGPAAGAAVPALVTIYQQTRDTGEPVDTGQPVRSSYVLPARYLNPQTPWPGPRPRAYYSSLAEQVLWTIGRMGSAAQSAIPFLSEELKNKTNRYRADVALAAWQVERNPAAVLPVLRDELRAQDPGVRRKVARALRWIGPEAVPTIVLALKDEDRQVRSAAVESLQTLGPAAVDSVPMLEQIMKTDSRNFLRIAAANALKRIRPEMADNWKPELLPTSQKW